MRASQHQSSDADVYKRQLHSGVAAKEPRFRLLIGGIALLREALHCLVASALLPYLVHRFLKQHIPAHAHGYADRLLLHG